MFYSIGDLVAQAKEYPSTSELVIATEMTHGGYSRERVIETMERSLAVMKQSVAERIADVTSIAGLTGGDVARLNDYIYSGNFLNGEIILRAVRNTIAVNEVNTKMGLTCVTPTAGSTGVVSGVLLAVIDRLKLTYQQQLDFLFTAGASGSVIANNVSISGAKGGCQAEVGSANAMANVASVAASGGTPDQSAQAVVVTIKSVIGLICDPVAGLVEVPYVKRGTLGSSRAFISADITLVGIRSVIPPDEVIHAMYQVDRQMPQVFKETIEDGLAVTPTAQCLSKEILEKQK